MAAKVSKGPSTSPFLLAWVREVGCLCSIAASRALNSEDEGFLVMMEAALQKRTITDVIVNLLNLK